MKWIYHISIAMLVLLLTGSCKREDFAELNKGNTPLALTASKTTIELKEKEKNNDALVFNWTSGTNDGSNGSITYKLQIAKQGSNFATPVSIDLGKVIYTYKYSVEALNNLLLNQLAAVPGNEYSLEARVIATVLADGIKAQTSPVVIVKIKPYRSVSTTLYLVGDATANGWDNSKATPLNAVANNPGAFRWTGNLSAGNFKFITTLGEWLPSYNKGATAAALVKRSDFGQPDDQWQITSSGLYTIEVDIINLSISLTQSSQPAYKKLWVVGDATPNGWNINNPNEMSVDSSNLFVFNYNEVLKAGEFKIPTATGNWGCDYFMPLVNNQSLTSNDVQVVTGGNPDNKWKITTAGAYKIKLDLLNTKIYIKPFTPYTQLWLVGDATPAGWNINNPTAMTVNPLNPYEFTWTGPMTAGEFKIPTATGNWGCDYFMPLVDQQGISSGLAKFVTAGNPDHKWRINTAGNYQITFNQLKETISIVKL